ncbi:MAG: hypothetical protein V8R64_07450 [Thomasclavelia sp.]
MPIVGGSILTHDHYQGGKHHFPMEYAQTIKEIKIKDYDVKVEMIKWPLSTLRLTGTNDEEVVRLSTYILNKWIQYSDEGLDIVAFTNERKGITQSHLLQE